MKLLAIETATEACSAALYVDGHILQRAEVAPQKHSELILPMCDALLAEAGLARAALDALAFGRGPGSFTGVRIGTGVIQGMAFALDLPVVPISSLAALAQGAFRAHRAQAVLTAIDARMDEVYWGAFREENGLMRAVGTECVRAPEAVPVPSGDEDWFGAGTGWGAYERPLRGRLGERLKDCEADVFPVAQDVVTLAVADFNAGLAVAAEQALPVYLRDEVVRRPT